MKLRKLIYSLLLLFACSFATPIALQFYLHPTGSLVSIEFIFLPFIVVFACGVMFSIMGILIYNTERCWP